MDLLLADRLTWNIPLLLFFLYMTLLYGYLFKRITDSKLFSLQPFLFMTSFIILYAIIGSPLVAISHLSFSLHMIQMSMLYFIVPPLLLSSIPVSMLQYITCTALFRLLRNYLIHSKVALYLFGSLFLVYHVPFVLQFLSQHSILQVSYSFILFVLALFMWWPIASPDSSQRLSSPRFKQYTMLSGLVITPACILFIVTALIHTGQNPFLTKLTLHLCIPAGVDAPSILPTPFNTKYDQVIAGLSMMGVHKISLVMTSKIHDKKSAHDKVSF